MERNKYFEVADRLYNEGKIDGEVYQAMIFNADEFCDDDDDCDDYGLPCTYAEIEYDDFDDPEAVAGARFDDMNFLRYMER